MEEKSKEEEESSSKKTVAEYIKRCIFLIVGLCIMVVGVVLSIKAALGTSPISSIPYVLNLITGLTVGTTTIIVNTLIVLLQIVLLRKRFKLIQLLQIPVCIVFGLMTDAAMELLGWVVVHTYWQQWLVCIAGIIFVAFGVSFEVTAKVVTLPGEGMALALCQLIPVKFGYVKIMVDVSLVVIAGALSLIFLHGLQGVREGTVAAAIFVGMLARQLNRFMIPFGQKFFRSSEKKKETAGTVKS